MRRQNWQRAAIALVAATWVCGTFGIGAGNAPQPVDYANLPTEFGQTWVSDVYWRDHRLYVVQLGCLTVFRTVPNYFDQTGTHAMEWLGYRAINGGDLVGVVASKAGDVFVSHVKTQKIWKLSRAPDLNASVWASFPEEIPDRIDGGGLGIDKVTGDVYLATGKAVWRFTADYEEANGALQAGKCERVYAGPCYDVAVGKGGTLYITRPQEDLTSLSIRKPDGTAEDISRRYSYSQVEGLAATGDSYRDWWYVDVDDWDNIYISQLQTRNRASHDRFMKIGPDRKLRWSLDHSTIGMTFAGGIAGASAGEDADPTFFAAASNYRPLGETNPGRFAVKFMANQIQLPAPVLQITPNPSTDGRPKLTWFAVSGQPVVRYFIERSTTADFASFESEGDTTETFWQRPVSGAPLDSGTHYFRVYARDGEGRTSGYGKDSVVVQGTPGGDDYKVEVSFQPTEVTATPGVKATFKLTIKNTGKKEATFRILTKQVTDWPVTPGVEEKTIKPGESFTDTDGSVTPPVSTPDGTYDDKVVFTIRCVDNGTDVAVAKLKVKVGDGTPPPGAPVLTTLPPNFTSLPGGGGDLTLRVTATDDTGLVSAAGEVTSPEGAKTKVALALKTGTATNGTWEGVFRVPPNDGAQGKTYKVTFSAKDTAGNEGFSSETTFTVPGADAEPPVLSNPQADPSALPSGGGEVTLRVTATDNVGVTSVSAEVTKPDGSKQAVSLSLKTGTATSRTWEAPFTAPANAGTAAQTYKVTFSAKDAASNEGASSEYVTFAVSVPARPPQPTPTTVKWNFGLSSLIDVYGTAGSDELFGLGFKGVQAYAGITRGRLLAFELSGTGVDSTLRVQRRLGLGMEGGADALKAGAGDIMGFSVLSGEMQGQGIVGKDYEFKPLANSGDAVMVSTLTLSDLAQTGVTMSPGVGPFLGALLDYLLLQGGEVAWGSHTDRDYVEAGVMGKVDALRADVLVKKGGRQSLSFSAKPGGVVGGGVALRGYSWVDRNIQSDEESITGKEAAVLCGLEMAPAFGLNLPTGLAPWLKVGGTAQGSLAAESRFDQSGALETVVARIALDPYFNLSALEYHTLRETQVELSKEAASTLCTRLPSNLLSLVAASAPVDLALDPNGFLLSLKEAMETLTDASGGVRASVFEEPSVVVNARVGVDIGAALEVGGGLRIGYEPSLALARRNLVSTAGLRGITPVDEQTFSRVPSPWEGLDGFVNFSSQVLSKAAGVVADGLKAAFKKAAGGVHETVEKVVNAAEGAAQVVADGAKWLLEQPQGVSVTITSWKPDLPFLVGSPSGARGLPRIAFRAYRTSSVVFAASRQAQAGQVMTAVGDIHRLRVETKAGSPVLQFPSNSLRLEVELSPEMLSQAGLAQADARAIAIFGCNPDDGKWYEVATSVTEAGGRQAGTMVARAYLQQPGDYVAGLTRATRDVMPPTITDMSPQDGSVVPPRLAVGALVTDNEQILSQSIDVKVDGTLLADVMFSAEGSGYRVAAMAGPLAAGEHTLSLAATDASGNQATRNVKVRIEQTTDPLARGMTMASIPFMAIGRGVDQILQSTGARFARYVGRPDKLYELFPEDLAVLEPEVGRGLWAKFATDVKVEISGVPISQTEPYAIALAPGWNLIGTPFLRAVQWDLNSIKAREGHQVLSLRQARDAGWVEDVAVGWHQDANNPNTGKYVLVYDSTVISGIPNQLEPWKGYWVKANQECEVILPPPTGAKQREAQKRGATGNGWAVRLQAHAGGGDSEGVIGETKSGKAVAVGLPPSPPTGTAGPRVLLFRDQSPKDPLAVDVRAASAATQTWEIVVEQPSADSGSVTLTWPDLSSVPRDLSLTLLDTVTGHRRYMRTTTQYVYNPTRQETSRRFQVVAHRGNAAPPLVSGLHAQVARGGGIQLTFSLNKDCETTVTARSAAGRVLSKVESGRSRAAGANAATWDGRDEQGGRLPAGVYVLEVVAADGEGRHARAMTPVTLRR